MTQNIGERLVSIVISAYNEEKYLPDLIEDLKNQTYNKKNIENIYKLLSEKEIIAYNVK